MTRFLSIQVGRIPPRLWGKWRQVPLRAKPSGIGKNLDQHHLNLDLLLLCPWADISLTSRNSFASREDSSSLHPQRPSRVGWGQIQGRSPGKHEGPCECRGFSAKIFKGKAQGLKHSRRAGSKEECWKESLHATAKGPGQRPPTVATSLLVGALRSLIQLPLSECLWT